MPQTWEEVEAQFARDFPDLDQDDLRRRFEAAIALGQERGIQAERTSEPIGQYIGRRSIPLASSLGNFFDTTQYSAARDRIDRGYDRPGDASMVADYERTQEIDQSRGLGGQMISGLAHVPGLVGEALAGGGAVGRLPMIGQAPQLLSRAAFASRAAPAAALGRLGATTAAIPAMYLPQAAERARDQGGEWYSPSNLAPAFIMGAAQTAVLGSLPQAGTYIQGSGIMPALGRLGARTVTGMGEQQVVDALAGAVDNLLPEVYQFRTRYGIAGSALRGEWGEAGKHAAVQAVTFAAFSALHPILHGEPSRETPISPEQPQAPTQPPAGMPRPTMQPSVPAPHMRPYQSPPTEQAPTRRSIGIYERPGVQESESMTARGPMDPRGPQRVFKDLIPAKKVQVEQIPPEQRVLDAYQAAMQEAAGVGSSKKAKEAAAQKVTYLHEAILGAAQAPTYEQAQKIVKDLRIKRPQLQAYADLLLETVKPKEASTTYQEIIKKPLPEQLKTLSPDENAPGSRISPPEPVTEQRLPSEPPIAPEVAKEAVPGPPRTLEGQRAELERRMATLTDRERNIIDQRNAGRSLEEIGKGMGVVRERVRQIEADAMGKLGAKESMAEVNKAEPVGLAQELAEKGKTAELSPETAQITKDLEQLKPTEPADLISEFMLAEMAQVEKKGLPQGPTERLWQHLLSEDLTWEMANAGKELADAYEKPLTIDDLGEIVRRARQKAKGGQIGKAPEGQALPPGPAGRGSGPEVRATEPLAEAPQSGRTEPVAQEGQAEGVSGVAKKVADFLKGEEGHLDIDELAAGIQRVGASAAQMMARVIKSMQAEPRTIVNRQIGRKAQIDLSAFKVDGTKLWKDMVEWYSTTMDEVRKIGGFTLPAMSRLNPELANAGALYTGRRDFIDVALPEILRSVVRGGDYNRRVLDLTGVYETRRRTVREQYQELADEAKQKGDADKAKEHQEAADKVHSFVGDPGSPFKTERDFQAWRNSSEGTAFLDAWKEHVTPIALEYYAKYKGFLEGTDFIGPSQHPDYILNGIRLSEQEMARRAGGGDPAKPGTGRAKQGDLDNVRQKFLQWDQKAENALPWEFYEMDANNVISKMINDVVEKGTQADYFRKALESGYAVKGPTGKKGVVLENGDLTWDLPVWQRTNESMFVSHKIEQEFRQSLALDHPFRLPGITPIAKAINKANIFISIQELVAHLKNIGTSMFAEGVFPFWHHFNTASRMFMKDKELEKRWLNLAKIDAGRAKGLESGQMWGGKYDPTSWGSELIHTADKIARLTLDEAFDRGVAQGRWKDTEINRRDFVKTNLGNYNTLTQSKLVKSLRESGIGPYATAGTTFYIQGLRMVGLGPNIEASSRMHDLGMRAERIAKAAIVLGGAMAVNKMLWGNALGDDDTPLGAIKTGKTKDGKTTHADFFGLTGTPRGMRQLGLLALAEGTRQGTSPTRITDRAYDQIAASLLHPMEGPVVSFVHTALSGNNLIGMDIARTPPPSGSRVRENLQAAALHVNPVIGAMFGHGRIQDDMDWGERALQLLGPYNPFKQRGDAILSEMHGRLTELNQARQSFNQQPGNLGRVFPQQEELRRLQEFETKLQRIEHAIKGQVKSKMGLRQGAVPEDVEIKRLRGEVSKLAKKALEASERVRSS